MQKRHADRQLYFNEQSITTQKYVIPFIEKHKPITADSHILEIGCGEGGNIKPFLDLGCQVTGIDINGGQIAIAKEIYSVHPNNRNLTLICEDIYKVTELHNKFDIIIIRDVIEHIPNQELFLPFIKRFLSPHGIIFVAFIVISPSQLTINNKFLFCKINISETQSSCFADTCTCNSCKQQE